MKSSLKNHPIADYKSVHYNRRQVCRENATSNIRIVNETKARAATDS